MDIRDIKTEIIGSFNAIQDSIKAKGVEVAEGTKPRELANKVAEVYDKATGDFWDIIQQNGNRTDYQSAFKNWSAEYIRPKYKVIPTVVNGATTTFEYCKQVKKIEAKHFDFSQKPTGNNNNAGYYCTFNGCSKIEEIEDIGLIPQYVYYQTFGYNNKLHTIAKIGSDVNTKYQNTFKECGELQNLTIDGIIGQNGFDIHWSTKLSAESLASIINALSTTTTGLTITLPTTAQANYEAVYGSGSWNVLTATRSNWTIAYA
jgi:hypothetical protein